MKGSCRACQRPTLLQVVSGFPGNYKWDYECTSCFRARAYRERWPGWQADLKDEGLHKALEEVLDGRRQD
jgi:hypothetical protein